MPGLKYFYLLLLVFTTCPGIFAQDRAAVSRSVCLLKSQVGEGSGFFADVQGMDAVITNNHLILELPDVRILDIDGSIYEYDTVYASPDTDLAVIPVKRRNHADIPGLPLHDALETLKNNAPVAVYGNSLAGGVIVPVQGRCLGIGPQLVEVDAAFVPGDSGGPVLDLQSGKVIGVAAYCTVAQNIPALSGSRFESVDGEQVIRRFAVRVDNIDLEKFEKVSLAQLKQDQEAFCRISKVCGKAMQIFNSPESAGARRAKLFPIFENKHNFTVPEKWHTSYLKQETEKKIKLLIPVYKQLYPESKEPVRMGQ